MVQHFQRRCWAIVLVAIALNNMVLTPGQAVSAWTGAPIVSYWARGIPLTPDIAQRSLNGGYNMVWVNNDHQYSVAQQYGLRTMLYDYPDLSQIDTFKWLSNNIAYFIEDEPLAPQFGDLASRVNTVRTKAPNALAFVNLPAIGGSTPNYGVPTYAEYLDQYMSTVNPNVLAYDHYPFMNTHDTGGYYLDNLSMIAQRAKQAGIPFVNTVQACAWDADWRIPTANELRQEVYSTLAYGAQGIMYWSYFTQYDNTGGLHPYAGGVETETYTALTPLNHEFVKVASQYQGLNWIGTYLKGYKAGSMPRGTTQLPSNSPFNISEASDTLSYTDGSPLKGVLLGFFDKDGTTLADATVALIQNLDYSASKTYTVTGPGLLSVFNATTGVWTATGHNYVTLNLAPGGGVLVGLTSIVPEPSATVLLGTGLGGLMLCAWRKRNRIA